MAERLRHRLANPDTRVQVALASPDKIEFSIVDLPCLRSARTASVDAESGRLRSARKVVVTRPKGRFLLHSPPGASRVVQASSPGRHKRRVAFPRGGSSRDASARQSAGVQPPWVARPAGTEALEQETGGAVRPGRPARHRVSERVARIVRASQARAARRMSGTWASQEARASRSSAK